MNALLTFLVVALSPLVAVGQALVWILLWPLVVLRLLSSERLGWSQQRTGPSIWLHGASLGEWNALLPLVDRLGGPRCVGSYMSRNAERAQVARDCADHAPLPLDLWPAYVLRMWRWQPRVIVIAEVDLWPTWLIVAWLYRVPLVWVNARLDRSMGKVLAILRTFYHRVLGRAVYVHAVDASTASSLRAWGYTVAAEGLNLKWARHNVMGAGGESGFADPSRVALLLASIHADERVVVEAAVQWWQRDPVKRLVVVAPRQLNELTDLRTLVEVCGGRNWEFVERYGVMDSYYRQAQIVVVGGTFDAVGGHNPVEAAVYGATVICGPSIYGQLASIELLRRTGNVVEVADGEQLRQQLTQVPGERCATDQLSAVLHQSSALADTIAARVQAHSRYN